MKHRDQGVAIVTVLMLIVILTGVFAVMTRLTILNLQQTGDSLRVTRTLAVAQGGRNFAQNLLQGPVGAKLGDSVVSLAQSNLIGNASTWVFAAGYTTNRPPANIVAQKLDLLSGDVQPRLAGAGCYGPYRVKNDQFLSVRITFTGQLPACDGEPASTVGLGEGRFLSGARNSTQEYSLPYVMVVAASEGTARRTLTVNGEYRFTVGNGSFARYALLTDQHQQSSNSANIYFTSRTLFNGPVHTNGNFAFSGEPWFGGAVSSSGIKDTGYKGGFFAGTRGTAFRTPSQLNPPKYSITEPEFTNGVSWDAPEIPFPTNSNDQLAAAQQAGLFINSANSTVVLSTGVGEAGSVMAGQQYQGITVTAGSTTTEYRVLEDPINGGPGPLLRRVAGVWTPVLNNLIPPTPITRFNGVIYGNGGIASLRGPARVPAGSTNPNNAPPALASFAGITVVSNDDIRITGDLKYSDNPCDGALSRNSNGTINVPNCSSDPLAQKNVLGIYSSGGAVRIGAGNGNSALNVPTDVQIQATIMADDTVAVENYETVACSLGTAYILGGVIQRKYGAFGTFSGSSCSSGLGRSFTYDQRMLNGLAPPFFPTTSMTNLMPSRQVIQYGQSEQDRR
ncbi:DUF4900 domain-containing protein [uncultured Deinococcus sp.]|uniref:DUF4900 domain-containing protein n=1 Tax=uncultured Deinococcus sp. TaxID=158789 RepID=UPI0025D22828|nr:DUF4900 domain-containing protein [uncultured Deinococcus sp.]